MKLQYHTDNTVHMACRCPVCERPYRRGTSARDLGTHDHQWLARLCIECAALSDAVLQVRVPASVIVPGADPDDSEAFRIAVDLSTVIRIDVDEEVSCDDGPQRFISVYSMRQHYGREHLAEDVHMLLKGWRARGR
jgi:hypothetical protein